MDVDEERLESVERKFDWPLLVAALLVIPVVAIDSSTLPSPWPQISGVLNWVSWLIFLAEAVIMLRIEGWRWVRSNPLPLLVTVVTVPILPANLDAVRVLRFARLLRVIPGAAAARRLFTLEGVKFAAAFAAATIVFSGVIYSHVESKDNPTALDGIWWALTTITTVGYGDLSPNTPTGKVLGGLVMLVGICFVALVTAFIAERFLAHDSEVEDDRERFEDELASIRDDVAEINRKLDLLLEGKSEST